MLGLRNETMRLRFVTFTFAYGSFAKYNQLIRVDTDLLGARCLWMEQINNCWI